MGLATDMITNNRVHSPNRCKPSFNKRSSKSAGLQPSTCRHLAYFCETANHTGNSFCRDFYPKSRLFFFVGGSCSGLFSEALHPTPFSSSPYLPLTKRLNKKRYHLDSFMFTSFFEGFSPNLIPKSKWPVLVFINLGFLCEKLYHKKAAVPYYLWVHIVY